jgi:DNA replicative helicase MCM subunit Mcm2 (Cdc46/Mcm family)
MTSLTIKRPVAVRVIVTEQYKEEALKELEEAVQTAQRDMERMEFEGRQLLAGVQTLDLQQTLALRREVEGEKNRREAVRRELQEQLEEVRNWKLGEEKLRGTLESTADIKEGDDLWEKLRGTEIVVKDGVVVEIRSR